MQNKKPVQKITKPYLTGAPTDENTLRQALRFFGMMLLVLFMTLLVCSMTGFNSMPLRIIVNMFIEVLILFVLYSKGSDLGTDAVARGEILYQHEQKGMEISQSERRIPFHKLKGFIIGLAGSLLFLICGLIIALTAQKQMTTAGALPSWMDAYLRRAEFRDALSMYTQTTGLSFTDIMRILVRVMLMPFISMAGSENSDLLLMVERLSPLLVLLPAFAYGTGYLSGPAKRTQVHSEIAENKRRRISKEKKERKARRAIAPKEPQQLN